MPAIPAFTHGQGGGNGWLAALRYVVKRTVRHGHSVQLECPALCRVRIPVQGAAVAFTGTYCPPQHCGHPVAQQVHERQVLTIVGPQV